MEDLSLNALEMSLTKTRFKKKNRVPETVTHGLAQTKIHLPLIVNGAVDDPLYYTELALYPKYYVAKRVKLYVFDNDFVPRVGNGEKLYTSVIEFILYYHCNTNANSINIQLVHYGLSHFIFKSGNPH